MSDVDSSDPSLDPTNPTCRVCGSFYVRGRLLLGLYTCRDCGEMEAKKVEYTVVPMPKSNYILVTDMSLLKGLNSSHKGGR